MTISEILKANGVSDEGIKAITEAMKQNKLFISAEENLDVRYGKLRTDHDGLKSELAKAKERIAELEKEGADHAEGASKIAELTAQNEALTAQISKIKLDSAVNVALLAAKAKDVDYMTFKLMEKGDIAIDENGEIIGWSDKLSALKTQFPNMFDGADVKNILPNKLPEQQVENRTPTINSLADALKAADTKNE